MPANGNAPREDHEEGGDLDRDEVERLLMEVQSISPYFRGFKDNIDLLAESLTVDRFEGGETILQEGEEGTWMGILLTGELEVVVVLHHRRQRRRILFRRRRQRAVDPNRQRSPAQAPLACC